MDSVQQASEKERLRKILIYIMGPLEHPNAESEIEKTRKEHGRVHHASEVGHMLSQIGFSVYVPHLNWYMTTWFPMERQTVLDFEMEILHRCDAGLFLGSSPGADRERVAMLKDGKPVFEDYSDALHVRAGRFDPSLDLIRGWDFGLTPACVFAQQLRSGHVQVLAEMQAKRAGIESFGEDVKRRTLELFPDCEQLLDVGDPSGEFGKDTEQAEHTAFGILHAMGIDMIPQSNDLTMRLGAVRHGLTRIVDGVPLLTIDPTCTLLRKALARDYQLRRKLVGTDRYSEKPEKGPASHIADALQYVCSEAFGYVLGTDGASTEPPERQSTYVDRADSVYAARQQTTYTG